MIELIGSIATALAITGVFLNNHRRRTCFLVWFVSNAASLGLHLHAGLYSLAVRDAAFLLLAVHGWVLWGRKKP